MDFRLPPLLDLPPIRNLIEFWHHRHPFVRVLLILALIAGLGGVSYRPVRDWWTGRKMVAAEQALAEGDYAEAREQALHALRRGGSERRMMPTLLAAAVALDDPRQVQIAFALITREGAGESDRQLAWEVLCEHAPARPLLLVWGQLFRDGRGDEAMAHAVADRLLRDGLPVEAAKVLVRMPDSGSIESETRQLELLLATATDEAHREFTRELLDLLETRPQQRGRWLAFLDRLPFGAMSPEQARRMRQLLTAEGPPEGLDRLRFARCEMRLDPDRADEHFQSALGSTGGLSDEIRARWCLHLGRPGAAAAVLAADPPLPGRLDLQWQIVEQTGDDSARQEFLEQAAGVATPPWLAELFRESLALLKGDEKQARRSRDQAIREARESVRLEAPAELARRAESMGLRETAALAWLHVVAESRGAIPLSDRLRWVIEFFADRKEEDQLLALLSAYRAIEPDNPEILAKHDYLACLQGRLEPAKLIAHLSPIRERYPDDLALRCLVGLGHLLLDQPQQARGIIGELPPDGASIPPIYRAIHALALAGSGEVSAAASLLEDFPWEQLMPSERQVLESLWNLLSNA